MKTVSEISSVFTMNKLKVTPQRVAVYQVLSKLKHASAEEIIREMKLVFPTATVATIYNVLECLTDNGIISKISTVGNKMYFDINVHDHGHLYCKKNQRIEDYDDENLLKMIKDYLENKKIDNFKIGNVSILIEGTFEKI